MPTKSPDQSAGLNGARRWATINDAAEYLHVSDKTIRTMIAEGRITGYRNGPRIIRVDLAELDAVMTPFGGALPGAEPR